MKSWLGQYAEFAGAENTEASVLAFPEKITIGVQLHGQAHTTLSWAIRDIQVRFDNSIQASAIQHTTEKGRLTIPGRDAMDFILEQQAEGEKPWYRKSRAKEWKRHALLLVATLAILVSLYFLLVPWMAEKMANNVSIQTEEGFGNSVYDALNLSAQEDMRATDVVNEFFAAMKITTPYNIRITVVKSEIVNAFALPGGHIVVYTGLLNELETYPELAALLSHEFTHVDKRHSTKSIFRKLGSRIFLGLLLGKMGSVTSVMIDQADNLKSLTYSRKLEKEADLSGLALLQERKIDPDGFVRLFDHLKKADVKEAPELLGSHPDLNKRVEYIREASKNSVIADNSELKTIFEKLK